MDILNVFFAVIFRFLDSVLVVLGECLEKEADKAVVVEFLVYLALSDSIGSINIKCRLNILIERTTHNKSERNENENSTYCCSWNSLPFNLRVEEQDQKEKCNYDQIA